MNADARFSLWTAQFSPLGAGSVGFAVTDLPGVLEILRVCFLPLSMCMLLLCTDYLCRG